MICSMILWAQFVCSTQNGQKRQSHWTGLRPSARTGRAPNCLAISPALEPILNERKLRMFDKQSQASSSSRSVASYKAAWVWPRSKRAVSCRLFHFPTCKPFYALPLSSPGTFSVSANELTNLQALDFGEFQQFCLKMVVMVVGYADHISLKLLFKS